MMRKQKAKQVIRWLADANLLRLFRHAQSWDRLRRAAPAIVAFAHHPNKKEK
jgi:hypothetical protein